MERSSLPLRGRTLSTGLLQALANDAPRGKLVWSVERVGAPEQRIWLKRENIWRNWSTRLRGVLTLLFGRIVGLGLPLAPKSGHNDDEPAEATRLRTLRQAGLDVPRLLGSAPGVFAMEDAGEDLRQVIQRQPTDAEREALVMAAFESLLRFHHAGHWHGGAQLRNVALRDGRILRVDFEALPGRGLPPALMQAMDLYTHLSSAMRYVGPGSLRAMATRWLDQIRSDAAEQAIKRLLRLLLWLRGSLLLRLARYEHQRLSAATDALQFAVTRAAAEGRMQPLVERRVPMRWRATLAAVALLLVSDNIYHFALQYDDPLEVDQATQQAPPQVGDDNQRIEADEDGGIDI